MLHLSKKQKKKKTRLFQIYQIGLITKKINSIYLKNLQFSKPWWLAGGISIEWIDEILTNFKPDGLDISSSIEIYPGLKDIRKTEDLFKFLKGN